MKKYCEILNNKVNYIFTEDDVLYSNYMNSNLKIKEITDKLTFQGLDIEVNCYYDELHNLYFNSESEYKSFQEMLLIYIEDLSFSNKKTLEKLNNQIEVLTQEVAFLKNNILLINDKIDSLAKLTVYLQEK